MSDELQQLHAVVSGRVQGVNFRYFTTLAAREIGVTGWVRNLSDGDVEVLAVGTREQLSRLLVFLHQGPPSAYVVDVHTQWSVAARTFSDFTVDYDGE